MSTTLFDQIQRSLDKKNIGKDDKSKFSLSEHERERLMDFGTEIDNFCSEIRNLDKDSRERKKAEFAREMKHKVWELMGSRIFSYDELDSNSGFLSSGLKQIWSRKDV